MSTGEHGIIDELHEHLLDTIKHLTSRALVKIDDAARLTGATQSQIHYLIRVGVVVPAKPPSRRGICAMFNAANLKTIRQAVPLLSHRNIVSRMKSIGKA